jgi:hypothetical protein
MIALHNVLLRFQVNSLLGLQANNLAGHTWYGAADYGVPWVGEYYYCPCCFLLVPERKVTPTDSWIQTIVNNSSGSTLNKRRC